jgi:hypothetical protein
MGSPKYRTSNPRLRPSKQGMRGTASVGVENGSVAFCMTVTARLFEYFDHTATDVPWRGLAPL